MSVRVPTAVIPKGPDRHAVVVAVATLVSIQLQESMWLWSSFERTVAE